MSNGLERLSALSRLFGHGTMTTWANDSTVLLLEQCHVVVGVFRGLEGRSRPVVQDVECPRGYIHAGPCVPMPCIISVEYLEDALRLVKAMGSDRVYLRICSPAVHRSSYDPNWRATVLELVTAGDEETQARIMVAGIQPGTEEVDTWERERDGVLPVWVIKPGVSDWFWRIEREGGLDA